MISDFVSQQFPLSLPTLPSLIFTVAPACSLTRLIRLFRWFSHSFQLLHKRELSIIHLLAPGGSITDFHCRTRRIPQSFSQSHSPNGFVNHFHCRTTSRFPHQFQVKQPTFPHHSRYRTRRSEFYIRTSVNFGRNSESKPHEISPVTGC